MFHSTPLAHETSHALAAKAADAAKQIAWFETPAALAVITAIDIDQLFLDRPLVVMGDDCLHFTGEGVEALDDVRRDAVAELFGATWREANDAGRAHEFLDFNATVPSVDAGLSAYFGDPREFGPVDPWQATLMMRFLARQKVVLDRRAAA